MIRNKKGQGTGFAIGGILIVLVIIIALILIFSSIYVVGAGERAVLLTWGSPDQTPQMPGLHFKLPIAQSAVIMSVQTLKYEAKASAASQDLQTVQTDVTINFHLQPDSVVKMYTEVGPSYQDVLIQPSVQEVVKAVTAKYTAEQLITQRTQVKDDIDTALRDRLITRNIVVDAVSITNFDFSQQFNAAIENKVTNQQNALAAEAKLAQVKFEAEQRVSQAQGEAEAIKIQAAAIQVQGGADYLQLQAINRWNGVLPQYTGSGTVPFINLKA